MAEAVATLNDNRPWRAKVLCRYFINGVCREGSNCKFSHDRNNGAAPDNVCKFYLIGQCTYGDKCRYDHVKPKPAMPEPITSRSPPKPTSKLPEKTMLINNNKSLSSPFGRMVSLKKHGSTGNSLPTTPVTITHKDPAKWAKAAEFVPGKPYKPPVQSSYADATKLGAEELGEVILPLSKLEMNGLLCPFAAKGHCPFDDECSYIHGDQCEFCGLAILHPDDKEQRETHKKECVSFLEKDMELSFAIAASKDKACGICMDIVLDKQPPAEQRFGIMSNCNHVFCLACIRKWRSNKSFENRIIRSCPECRTVSDFVTPSKYWVEAREEKDKLIEGYKKALSEKPCRYFNQGKGECPFNEKCFYLHAYPDGRIAEPQPRRRRRRANADGDLDLLQQIILWDFFEENQNRVMLELDLEEELERVLTLAAQDLLSDSSDSDYDDWWL